MIPGEAGKPTGERFITALHTVQVTGRVIMGPIQHRQVQCVRRVKVMKDVGLAHASTQGDSVYGNCRESMLGKKFFSCE